MSYEISLFFLTKLLKAEIVSVFYVIVNFVIFLLTRFNLFHWILSLSRLLRALSYSDLYCYKIKDKCVFMVGKIFG